MDRDNILELKTPRRRIPSGSATLLNPKRVKAWISTLPMANIGSTSKQIFNSLGKFNRLDRDDLDRATTINLFRQPISYITDNLKKHYIDLPFPLSTRNQKIAALSRELQSEMANGFKIIIKDILTSSKEERDNKLLTVAIHQAILYISRVLYYSAVVYNQAPHHAWREIYQLFRYAELHNLAETKVKEDGGETETSSTIRDVYQRAILFGMASPYSMRQREIEYFYNQVTQWSPHLDLKSVTSHKQTATIFVIEPSSDQPPCHAYLHTAKAEKQYQTVNTTRLVSQLQQQLKTLAGSSKQGAPDTTKESPSKPLLRKLIQSLGSTPKRQFPRTALNFDLDTAIGLSSVYALIIENSKKPERPKAKARPHLYPGIGDEVKLSIAAENEPIEFSLVGLEETAEVWLQDEIKPAITIEHKNQAHNIFSCKTFNESAGGYCLTWSGDKAPHIRIGEIIGIQSTNNPSQFSIGVTRWMKSIPTEGLQIGIEMIALHINIALVRHMNSPSSKNQNPEALLLPEQTTSEQPDSLIVHALPYRVNDSVWIDDGRVKRRARLTRLLESTGAFSRFQYTYTK